MTLTRPTVSVEIDFTTNLSSGLAYSEKVLSDGPYHYLRLQESAGTSAADASGNGSTGTYAGTFTLNQTAGKPVSGETASRYVNLSTGGQIGFTKPPDGATKVTWEAWVYRSTLNGNAATKYWFLVSPSTGPADSDIYFGLAMQGDGKMYLKGPTERTSTAAVFSAATWYHVAVVGDIDNSTYTFYVNGAVVASTWAPSFDQELVWFQKTGANPWAWGGYTGGTNIVSRIAEPAMYLTALTASQISDHYNAAATTPFSGYTWTNVSTYLDDRAPLTRRFGRESALGEVAPMELTFTLLNRDRRFEPEYSSSPYYPNVEAGRPVRVTMTQNAVTYDWAFGFIQDFPQEYPESDTVGSVPIVANCMLERMNQDELGSRAFLQQLTGSRINSVLNIAGQPSTRRTLDAGANNVMVQDAVSGSPGSHALQVARTDRGMFFFDGQGYAVFQDGNYRTTNARSTVSQGTLGHADVDYTAPDFHAPMEFVKNEIVLRRPGGVDQTAVDATSRSKRGRRNYTDELLLTTDAAMATRAAALLADYKDPLLRVRSVTFTPLQSTGKWEDSLGVKLSDRYTWVFDPLQGTTLTRDVFVEGVADSYNFREGDYTSTWFLNLV